MRRIVRFFTNKRTVIVCSIILTLVGGLILSAYLILHSYIQKINIVEAKQDNTVEASEKDQNENNTSDVNSDITIIEPEPEDDPTAPDSSEDEIRSVETMNHDNVNRAIETIMCSKEVKNILLIGSDSRTAGGRGRSDAMILVSINKKTKKIIATSILRDIYLQIPGKKINNRINAAYAFGGADLLMDTIEENFRIKVDHYASIDFYAFVDIVDAVGGVSLNVSEKEIPVINGYIMEMNRLTGQEEIKDCLTEPGTLLLSGKQALGYARNRYVGNSDFERTARQRRVLEQIFEKVKSSDLTDVMELLNVILPQVTTNLTEGEVIALILALPSYIDYDIEQWSIPVENSYSSKRIRGMAVLSIDFDENISELHDKVYGEILD